MITVEENDDRFYIKKSKIKNAGKGVFAKRDIKKNEFLNIIGVAVKLNSPSMECTHYADRYKFAYRDKDFDRVIVPMGCGGIVNHTTNKQEQNVEIRCDRSNNSSNPSAGFMSYYFIKNVKKDEEVLGNYNNSFQKTLDWAKPKSESINKDINEWLEFLNYDLYDLKTLKELIKLD